MLRKMAVILIAFAMATFIFMPLSSATAAGSDDGLDAVIVGSDVFNPGATAQVQIVVQNNNTVDRIDAGAAQAGVSQYYGAAVSLTAALAKGNAPITVKTDRMLLGTLPTGAATSAIPFTIEVDDDAQPGVYQAQLMLTYSTLVSTSMKASGEVDLQWSTSQEVLNLNLEIQEEQSSQFAITSLESDLKPGVRNVLKVVFKNNGNETAGDASVEVSANPPLTLTDDTSFLGTLEPGDSAVATFGVRVAGDAILKQYALDAFVTYQDQSGDEHESKQIEIPVLVSSTPSRFVVTRGEFFDGLAGAAAIAVIWLIWYFVTGERRKKAA
jgi:hypothetical protein